MHYVLHYGAANKLRKLGGASYHTDVSKQSMHSKTANSHLPRSSTYAHCTTRVITQSLTRVAMKLYNRSSGHPHSTSIFFYPTWPSSLLIGQFGRFLTLGYMDKDKYYLDQPMRSFDIVLAFHCFGLPCFRVEENTIYI